ncbi:tyrosine-type recombinase/integrase [Levilactobacillus bambusae]|uniref:Site-specific integrase n=1 Tax=Levilactobacillus bambusae TaxID=2024736 RepID=A0A2V1N1S0_9LACO|nr:tyrosine-type recombinase/integrase [Levilactobacillus bambusae]PWG00992.1 hypothetical protein DCM90_02120 [Levilactobacillus bambusae]
MAKLNYSRKYPHVFNYQSHSKTFWGFRYNYYDEIGKRHEKQLRGFTTAKIANEELLKIQLKISENNATIIENSEVTMKSYAQLWFKAHLPKWRPNTIISNREAINHYILPYIGQYKLRTLTMNIYLRTFINPLSEKVSPSTVRVIHSKVMQIINDAVNNDIIPRNRLQNISLPASHTRQAFTPEDLKKFNDALHVVEIDFRVFFLTIEYTGMRRGEALGLEWDDIDFNRHTISIRRSRIKVDGPTKTPHSVRTISISQSLVDLLKKYHIHQQKKNLKSKGPHPIKVFTGLRNHPLIADHCNKKMKAVLKEAGLTDKHYVIHSFRHTQASILMNDGMNPVDIAKRLGHSSVKTTLDIYSHAVDDNDQKLADTFEKNINNL